MKLITHNMLTSNILKGVTKGFPLRIQAAKVENVSVDYNRDFIARILARLEYDALRAAVKDVSREWIWRSGWLRIFFCFFTAWFEWIITGNALWTDATGWRVSENDASGFVGVWSRRRRIDLSGKWSQIPDFQRHSEHAVARNGSILNSSFFLSLLLLLMK